MDRLVVVLLVLKVQNANVEVGFKVLWVDRDRSLIKGENFGNDGGTPIRGRLQALGQTVDRVDVLGV